MQKIFIVIPAYNEKNSISHVVDGLLREGYKDIVVVDDCSTDSTARVAEKAGAVVLRHIINRGQGAALRTGMDYAIMKGADIIINFDADGQHNPKEVKDLVRPIIKKESDVALGSRFLKKGSNIPLAKKIVLKLGVLFTFIFSGIWLTDTHNGFRALSRKAAQMIEIKQDRMEHASEIIDQIKRKRIKYTEVPVTIMYTPYSVKKGQSALNSIRIAWRLVWSRFLR